MSQKRRKAKKAKKAKVRPSEQAGIQTEDFGSYLLEKYPCCNTAEETIVILPRGDFLPIDNPEIPVSPGGCAHNMSGIFLWQADSGIRAMYFFTEQSPKDIAEVLERENAQNSKELIIRACKIGEPRKVDFKFKACDDDTYVRVSGYLRPVSGLLL